MKLHKIFLFATVALATTFASCSSDDNVTVGEQDSTDKPFAYMDASNKLSFELDPSDATEISFNVCRTNTNSAAEIPLNVEVNTDNVYQVPATASFAAGSAEATVKVTFPSAVVGTTYTLKVGFTPEYAGIYKDALREQTFTVTRVKWNDVGSDADPVYLIDDFWYGGSFQVKLQQRDDDKTAYRFESPYTDEVTGGGGTYQQWITFRIAKNDAVTFDSFYFNTMYDEGQEIYAYGLASYADYNSVTRNEDGTINYVTIAPYWYVLPNVGGWSPANGYNLYVVFPGQAGPFTEEAKQNAKQSRPTL